MSGCSVTRQISIIFKFITETNSVLLLGGISDLEMSVFSSPPTLLQRILHSRHLTISVSSSIIKVRTIFSEKRDLWYGFCFDFNIVFPLAFLFQGLPFFHHFSFESVKRMNRDSVKFVTPVKCHEFAACSAYLVRRLNR